MQLNLNTLNASISSFDYNEYDDVLHFRTASYNDMPAYAKEPEDGVYMYYDMMDDDLVAITVIEVKTRKEKLYQIFKELGLPIESLDGLS